MKRTSKVLMLPASFRAILWLGIMLLFIGFGMHSTFADEPEYATFTDVSGKFKLEAKILGIDDEKVQLQAKDGRVINVALNKLSPESLRLVEAAKPSKKTAPGSPAAAQKTIPYALTALDKAEIHMFTVKMEAEGIPVGKAASATIQVSDSLAVSGVPVSFIKALAARKLIYLQALGLIAEGEERNRRAVLKGLAMDWTLPTIVASGGGEGLTAEKPEPLLAIIRADGSLAATLAADSLPLAKPNLGRLFWNEVGVAQDHLPLATLLRRFDPASPVTEANAAEVAEELVWSQELKISDGSFGHLADTRLALQAAMLEVLQFEIGDPQDEDQPKQKQARELLQKGRAVFQQTWEEGFAEPAKTKK